MAPLTEPRSMAWPFPSDFSVVLFRPNFMLVSEECLMKTHKNQWLLNPLSPLEQPPRSTRRNALPVKLIDGPLLMRHQYLACALVYQMEIGKTPSRSNAVFHHAPEAFTGI